MALGYDHEALRFFPIRRDSVIHTREIPAGAKVLDLTTAGLADEQGLWLDVPVLTATARWGIAPTASTAG